jgi:hypothetical protein
MNNIIIEEAIKIYKEKKEDARKVMGYENREEILEMTEYLLSRLEKTDIEGDPLHVFVGSLYLAGRIYPTKLKEDWITYRKIKEVFNVSENYTRRNYRKIKKKLGIKNDYERIRNTSKIKTGVFF